MSDADANATSQQRGRIITFYSYKGGTGRSMAVANVAWILASQSKKVIVIDWDLEAPGLHRYFHPFLDDKELTESQGTIDFFVEFFEGARFEHKESNSPSPSQWFDKYANLLPYAYSLSWEFPKGGTLDFVPAGQQGPGYGVRVMTFDWQSFYDRLGGGVFLEIVKKRLRDEYDYILIDSRTGISDTAGICTVQMPDDLVVCFTLNHQSIRGGAAAASSAFSQRRKPNGEPGLRIWPVPTRVELAEKERLEAARDASRSMFQQYLGHLTRSDREEFWASIEVPYDPYFAYEEVLAAFAERRRSKLSVLDSMLALVNHLTSGQVKEMAPLPEGDRRRILSEFSRVTKQTVQKPSERTSTFFLSFEPQDREMAQNLGQDLNFEMKSAKVVWSELLLRPGDLWREVLTKEIQSAAAILVLVSENWITFAPNTAQEVKDAIAQGLRIVPLLTGVSSSKLRNLPFPLNRLFERQGFELQINRADSRYRLIHALESIVATDNISPENIEENLEDPQKGRWGGRSSENGRTLNACVKEITPGWFEIRLEVTRASGPPLEGDVEFHLHPTFQIPVIRVPVENGQASTTLSAWGAFTVGVAADEGRTHLELDLATLDEAPLLFRQR